MSIDEVQELHERFKELLSGSVLTQEEKDEVSRKILEIIYAVEEEVVS